MKAPNHERTMKTMFRGLTPPFVWNLLERVVLSSPNTNGHGLQRPSDFYDSMYLQTNDYHQHYTNSRYYFLWCVLVDRMHPEQVRGLLDIGCGPGQMASFLRDRGLRAYVGVDFSQVCIGMAREACRSFEFVCTDVFATDLFETFDYDVVIATEFLEHLEDDLLILERIRPGTRVYGSVPNFPDPSHVRYFRSADEVGARYSSWLADLRVDEILFGSEGMSFFLIDGVRASPTASN
jgi:SAM-dependent methyltransferase